MRKLVSVRRGSNGETEKKRWMTLIICLSMLLGILGVLVGMPSVRAELFSDVWVDDGYVNPLPPYFNEIYDALDYVDENGTIHVDPGNYTKSFTVDKNLSIVENGTGERVLLSNGGNAITITNSTHVNISGLTIHETHSVTATTGIVVTENSFANITNCKFLDLNMGVFLNDSSSARIDHNIFHQIVNISYPTYAARFVLMDKGSKGEDTTISNNTAIFKYLAHGITAYNTPIQLVENNNLYENYSGLNCYNWEHELKDGAINLYQHSAPGWTTVRNNTASGFCWGVSTEGANATVENNTFTDSHIGISSFGYYVESTKEHYTSNLTVANNTVTFRKYGLQAMHYWSYIYATNNNITAMNKGSGIGVLVGAGGSNGRLDLDSNNTISNSGLGVRTYGSTFTNASGNIIFGTGEGFHSEGTDNIRHNEFYSNDEGIRVQGNPSYGNRIISNNTITGSSLRAGIWVYASSNSDEIQNNEITQGYRGIWITDGSSSKLIRWNNISNNHYGIHIDPYESSSPGSNYVKGNNISMNEYGIYVHESDGNDFQNNNVSGNRRSGILLDSVESVKIEHSNISNNFIGIMLTEVIPSGVEPFSIKNNSILGNTLWAINSTVTTMIDATFNFFGAWNNDSIEEMISGDITYNPWLQYRESNVEIVDFMSIPSFPHPSPYYVEKGMIVNGTLMVGPDADIIFNNSLGQNFIQVNGVMNAFWDSTFSSNFGNFTVIYLNGSTGGISDSTFEGQMGVSIQSSGISVSHSTLTNGTAGIIINRGESNSISHSEVTNNREGILINQGEDNTISHSEIAHNGNYGTYLLSSSWNNLTDNEIIQNDDFGIKVNFSENNAITGRNVSASDVSCVYLYQSSLNKISLLNITSCTNGIYSESSPSNTFASNNISATSFGVQLVSSSTNSTIQQNNISNNFVGITVNSSTYQSHINNNSILGNVFYAISAPTASPLYLDAEDNYFGTNSSSQMAKLVTSYVDYTPWRAFRESNVEYIDNYTEWTSNRSLGKGVIVNASGCLNITGTSNSPVTITFNNTHGQNFIQVNNASNLKNSDVQGANRSFTLLYLDSTNGRIEHSNISGFRGLGIQSEEEILEPNGGIVLHNSDFYQSSYGVVLHRARNTLVEESSFISNTPWGMYLHSSSEIDIGPNNNISHNRHGFYLEESTQNDITGNEFYSNTYSGLTFEEFWPSAVLWSVREYSVYNDMTNNTFVSNNIGTFLGNVSKLNNVTESNFTSNTDGAYIIGSWSDGRHKVALNEFYKNDNGVHIEESIYNNISENSFVCNARGIYVEDSTPFMYPFSGITNKVANNSILNGAERERGIYLLSSERNFIYNNWVNSTFGGVNGTHTFGILLEFSSSNEISQNEIRANNHGIRLHSSDDNNLTSNEMTNNFYNFGVTGTEIDHFPQEINTSNLVNGTEVYYWVGINDSVVPSNAGYVGLVSCSNISVPNVTIHNNLQGILLVNTTHSTIQNVTVNWTLVGAEILLSANITVTGYDPYRSIFKDNKVGVRLQRTNYSRVEYSNFTNNSYAGVFLYGDKSHFTYWNNVSRVFITADEWCEFGIRLDFSKYTTISNSTVDKCWIAVTMDGDQKETHNTVIYTDISNSTRYGLRLRYSLKNLVVNNSFHSNAVGVEVGQHSQYNKFYHNNFQGNTNHHSVYFPLVNAWDNGYPEPDPLLNGGGGNWWCGVDCTDEHNGTNENGDGQQGPEPDGICDDWYVLNDENYNNVDKYPLLAPAISGPQDE